jgi:hypothetical protein
MAAVLHLQDQVPAALLRVVPRDVRQRRTAGFLSRAHNRPRHVTHFIRLLLQVVAVVVEIYETHKARVKSYIQSVVVLMKWLYSTSRGTPCRGRAREARDVQLAAASEAVGRLVEVRVRHDGALDVPEAVDDSPGLHDRAWRRQQALSVAVQVDPFESKL